MVKDRRISADIGGTFTDLVIVSDDGQTFKVDKVLTTPEQPDDGVIAGVQQVLAAANTTASSISHVIHGTTLFTNALIERKGARTALVTTTGFRDAIEIAREHRYDMYDLRMRKPTPIAPRDLRFEVRERILADGSVRTPLDVDDAEQVADRLSDLGITAIAVCLIHSYANPEHERRLGDILRRRLPAASITLSSEVVPEIREYDRTSTTLANVYVQQLAESYLTRLRVRLESKGITGKLFIMQSNGGVCEVETGVRFPVRLVESGPAGGALAAAHYGARLGHKDLLSFDMGGTTAKACVIVDGEPLIAPEFEVDRQYQFKKGSGLPIKVPVIEMIEIGTGGGSIARVDALRRLQVGPDSAGAKPGPAAYARGGEMPTVTDADLVLGFLDPAYFLGGEIALDVSAARRAINTHVAEPLGLGLEAAAWGIHQLANESMASAARIHAIERGKDVERFPIFAFGGAGPVHAFGVANILNSPSVIYPLGAGVMSAIGFLTAPLSFDFVRTLPAALYDTDWDAVNAVIADMEHNGREILGRTISTDQISFRHFADMRYRKQGYEIRVALPVGPLNSRHRDDIQTAFEHAYVELYGHTVPNTPIEIVSWRLIAQGPTPRLELPRPSFEGTEATTDPPASACKEDRMIYRPGLGEFQRVPVYDRYLLPPGVRLAGPLVIEERESTVVVNEEAAVRVDADLNVIVDRAGAQRTP